MKHTLSGENIKMNRINKLFQEKRDNILSIYFTAGYPSLNDTEDIIKTLDDCGVDLIEIGMPFSDPIADGPVIQDSSNIAIDNGMNLNVLFKQLLNIRKITSIPIVLMGYINPVYQFGYEKFINSIIECDLDGLILPDLPLGDYKSHFKDIFDNEKKILLVLCSLHDYGSFIKVLNLLWVTL